MSVGVPPSNQGNFQLENSDWTRRPGDREPSPRLRGRALDWPESIEELLRQRGFFGKPGGE
jgi:hypothetical protein